MRSIGLQEKREFEVKEVGYVCELSRYIVKSMQGEFLQELKVSFTGVRGDRRYAFVKSRLGGYVSKHDKFPWFTARDNPNLVLYKPQFDSPDDIEHSPVRVVTPEGKVLRLDNEELRNELLAGWKGRKSDESLFLLELGRGAYDGMPVSLVSKATVDSVCKKVSVKPDVRRFRPNILVETFEEKEGIEDEWIFSFLVFGERPNNVVLLVVREDPRCMVINIDPNTGKQTPSVLRYVVNERGNNMGVYATVAQRNEPAGLESVIRLADPVYLIKLK